jgi:hypothetical protein
MGNPDQFGKQAMILRRHRASAALTILMVLRARCSRQSISPRCLRRRQSPSPRSWTSRIIQRKNCHPHRCNSPPSHVEPPLRPRLLVQNRVRRRCHQRPRSRLMSSHRQLQNSNCSPSQSRRTWSPRPRPPYRQQLPRQNQGIKTLRSAVRRRMVSPARMGLVPTASQCRHYKWILIPRRCSDCSIRVRPCSWRGSAAAIRQAPSGSPLALAKISPRVASWI